MRSDDIAATNATRIRLALGIAVVGIVAVLAFTLRDPSDRRDGVPDVARALPAPTPTRPIDSPPDISPPVATSARPPTSAPPDAGDPAASDTSPPTVEELFGERIVAVSYRPRPTVILLGGARFRTGDVLPSGAVLDAIGAGYIGVLVDGAELILALAPHDTRRVPEVP